MGFRPLLASSVPQKVSISGYLLACLLISIAVFFSSTTRTGNPWPDDYALYVHHAENLAHGRAYADTGYVYNPRMADYSPRAYPPVFPLFLAPVSSLFGLNFQAMKMEEIAFFLLALITIFLYWKDDLSAPYLIALSAVLGYNPRFWAAKDDILSDLPFLFFFYLSALLAERSPRTAGRWWKWAIITGIVIYVCIGTRTIGVALIPGLLLYDVAKYKRLTGFTACAVVVSSACWLVQRSLLGSGEQSYADQLHPTISTVKTNLFEYARSLSTFWPESLGPKVTLTLFAVITVLACIGACCHLKRGPRAADCFLVPYLAIVLLWPSTQGLRFLFPLLPFYVYLALFGLSQLSSWLPAVWFRPLLAGMIAITGVSYGVAYLHTDYGVIPQADGLPSFNELCRVVQSTTGTGDVFIFRRPRTLSLFASRPAAVYDIHDADDLLNYARSIRATYVISSPLFEQDRQQLIPFIEKHPANLLMTYQNQDFRIYRIKYPLEAGAP